MVMKACEAHKELQASSDTLQSLAGTTMERVIVDEGPERNDAERGQT